MPAALKRMAETREALRRGTRASVAVAREVRAPSPLKESAGFLPSEGKGQRFESPRARHDFKDLARKAFWPFGAAEAPRKHPTADIRIDCRTLDGVRRFENNRDGPAALRTSSWSVRLIRDEGVAGSNPATPTKA
jgi:hypothetical protein